MRLPTLVLVLVLCPSCKGQKAEPEPRSPETGKTGLVREPSEADRKFLSTLEKLPRTDEETRVERWTSLGITVESGWAVEMGDERLVIEHTDLSKKDLAQHYLDKLGEKGWEQTGVEAEGTSFRHTLERDGVTLVVIGDDRKGGGATVTLVLTPPGGRD